MTDYSVYATRWDDPHKVEDLLPARDLQFSMPVSAHGEASFSATVEPGESFWRPAVGLPLSGLLIARDGQPCWSGWFRAERQTGPRTFQFAAREWGSFFEKYPAPTSTFTDENDHVIFRSIVSAAQAVAGQDARVTLDPSTMGAATSDLTIPAWDTRSVDDVLRELGNAEGGPEWYFGTAGTLDNPLRILALADRHGSTTAADVLHHVEDTAAPTTRSSSVVMLLGDLFPAGTAVPAIGRRGGNVLAVARDRDTDRAATVADARGDGIDRGQKRSTEVAQRLLDIGWPRMTRRYQHSSVTMQATLDRHAVADLATDAGIATRYGLVTLDGEPDWTAVSRGSTMRVILDTDVYGGPSPLTFESRVLNMTVNVPDQGAAQVTWDLAETLTAS